MSVGREKTSRVSAEVLVGRPQLAEVRCGQVTGVSVKGQGFGLEQNANEEPLWL